MTKNKNYKEFLETGMMRFLKEEHLKDGLKNVTGIRGKHIVQGRCLVIALYYTGARPVEILRMKSNDFTREGSFVNIIVTGKKGSKSRRIQLQYKRPLVKELWNYSQSFPPGTFIFFDYKGHYVRYLVNKKGEKSRFVEETHKIRYHVTKWFAKVFEGGINPYYFRHNKFSKMIDEGATDIEIKFYKGAKSLKSVDPYVHMSSARSKKLARFGN